MKTLAPVARPVFEYNHNVVMRWGGEGLARRLGARADRGGLSAQPAAGCGSSWSSSARSRPTSSLRGSAAASTSRLAS